MNFVEVSLYDADSQEVFKLKLNPNDAIKAENDVAFATALLKYARQNVNQRGITHQLVLPNTSTSNIVTYIKKPCVQMDTTPLSPEEEVHTVDSVASLNSNSFEEDTLVLPNTDEEFVENGLRWSHEAILLLLEEYRQREQEMYSGTISHKRAWEQIAQTLKSKGYVVTARQCNTRFNTMKRTYKAIKDHNKKSGNNKRTWQYLDVMQSLLGEKPYMAPLSTVSSTGVVTEKPTSSSLNLSSNINILEKNITVPRKRKSSNVENEEIAERRREREKRHREKMEAKEKLLEKLDKIIDKL